MATTRKKPKDGEGGMRVDKASDKPNRARIAAGQSRGSAEPVWQNPRLPLPASTTEALLAQAGESNKPAPPTPVEKALKEIGPKYEAEPTVIAAVILAQALDRLGQRIIEAAAVSRYRNGP